MKISREMLEAAMGKAIEAGLLPRHAPREDVSSYEELMRFILQAALQAAALEQGRESGRILPRRTGGARGRLSKRVEPAYRTRQRQL